MIKKIGRAFLSLVFHVNMFLWYTYFRIFLKGTIIGQENLPKEGFIVAANHVSYLDWIILYTIFRRKFKSNIYFLAKAKLKSSPLWNFYLQSAGTIIIDYDDLHSLRQGFASIHHHLQNKEVVGIFPEGTRSPDGRLLPANEGIGRMVLNAGAPIVPIGLNGFYQAWPRHKRLPGIAPCTIKIGEPVYFNINDYPNRKEAKSAITHLIMKHIGELIDHDYGHTPAETHKVIQSLSVQHKEFS